VYVTNSYSVLSSVSLVTVPSFNWFLYNIQERVRTAFASVHLLTYLNITFKMQRNSFLDMVPGYCMFPVYIIAVPTTILK